MLIKRGKMRGACAWLDGDTHSERVTAGSYARWVTGNEDFSHRLVKMLAIFWGAEILKLMGLVLVWWMKFSPSHRWLTLQLTVQYSCQFLNYAIPFQWFKQLLVFVKNLVVHIKYNCTHKTINIVSLDFSVLNYLLQKEPSFSFSLNNQSSH